MNTNYNNPQDKESRKATIVSATAGIAGGAALGVGAAAVYSATAHAENPGDESPYIEKTQAPVEEEPVVAKQTVEVHHHHHNTQPQAEVVEYNMVVDDNGNHIADMAQVNYRGENIVLVDSDLDGMADTAWFDHNRNNIVEENEIYDMRSEHIAMNTIKSSAQNIAVVKAEPDPEYLMETDTMAYRNQEEVVEDVTGSDDMDYSQNHTSDNVIETPDLTQTTDDISMNTIDTDMPDYVNDADVDAFIG